MLEFNSRNIISGYIKQLLMTINLPCCKVFSSKEECSRYFKEATERAELNTKRKVRYNSKILALITRYKPNEDWFVFVDLSGNITEYKQYRFNHPYINITRTLKLMDDTYDAYTHRYLGDYLRFLKSFKHINLLSMYNCFTNETEVINDFKYLLIPVKYNTNYTLFYNYNSKLAYNYTTDTSTTNLNQLFNSSTSKSQYMWKKSRQPILITTPSFKIDGLSYDRFKNWIFWEDELRLVIKVPVNENFPLVILEGDYSNYSSNYSRTVINFEREDGSRSLRTPYLYEKEYEKLFSDKINNSNFQLVEKLDVSDENFPIADRLIEYLIDNAITSIDTISKNVIDAKYKMYTRYLKRTKDELGILNSSFTIMDRFKMLDTISLNTQYPFNKEDLLGYVDKDIESALDDERYPDIKKD